MTTVRRGRQYPDGPLEAPPDWPALTLEIPADPERLPAHFFDEPPWLPAPEAAGGLLRIMLGATEPGPPYTHTFAPPPVVCTRSGKVLYRPPAKPSFTLTEGTPGSIPAGS